MSQRSANAICCAMFGLSVLGAGFAQSAAPPADAAGPAQTAPVARAARTTPACGSAVNGKNMAPSSRCFELRTYTLRPGGAGDIDLLHARFREATARLFAKHGMNIIGFWQPVAMPDTLVYMLAYKDNATRDAQWAAFNADPEWVEARSRMNVDVTVVNVFMNASDYSPIR